MFYRLLNNIRNISSIQLLLILLFLWALIQASYFKKFGIVTTLEATKYIDECQQLFQYGHFSDNKYLFYSVYILIHIFFYKLGFEFIGVYLFQLLLNLVATYFFFQLNYKITKKKSIAFVAVLLLLLTQTFQMWTVYLYTESLFSSLVIIFTYSFFILNQQNKKDTILKALLFILLIFARPTGLLFIPVIFVYFFFFLIQQKRYLKALLFTIAITFGFFGLLNYAMQSSTTFNFIKPLLENQIICDVPIQTLYKPILPTTSNTLFGILDYIFHNKGQFLFLASRRFISYWGMQRSTNSHSHNLFFACFFYPLYFMGLIGSIKLLKQHKAAFIFIISTFFFFTLSVIFSCDEWSNRFMVPIIPFIMMLGAIGINSCYYKIGRIITKWID